MSPIRNVLATLVFASSTAFAPAALAACAPGAYGRVGGDFVAIAPVESIPAPGLRYLFRDGRRGSTADADAAVRCRADGTAEVRLAAGGSAQWPRIRITATDATFDSVQTRLAGRLLEPAGAGAAPPLVVQVHGSGREPAIDGITGYLLAAQGLAVFTYDKRGTGASKGVYSQNFELLADDAAAALAQAKRLAAGRIGRAGYLGESQGGWIAPLAATRSEADFVVVAYGLIASPIEEDRDELLVQGRAKGLDDARLAQLRRLSAATARVVSSRFTEGFEALEAMRRELADAPWMAGIDGEYSVALLRTGDADLRRIGRARFDSVGLIWDYRSLPVLERLQVPLLWVLAGEDTEAPIEDTRAALERLAASGRPVDAWLFPDTDHGMVEFAVDTDGRRRITRVTEGYLPLLGDWIRGAPGEAYGRGQRLTPAR